MDQQINILTTIAKKIAQQTELTTQHPTLSDTINRIDELGTYKQERPKFDIKQAWRTPSTTEYSYNNTQIISNASIKTAECCGICIINDKGRIAQEGIQDPNQETYFHTDPEDLMLFAMEHEYWIDTPEFQKLVEEF